MIKTRGIKKFLEKNVCFPRSVNYFQRCGVSRFLFASFISIAACLPNVAARDFWRLNSKTMQQHFDVKLKTLKSEKNIFIKKRKLQGHLLQKGFETDLIRGLIAKL